MAFRPIGYNYLSPAPPLFATPFINAGDGVQQTDPYPFNFRRMVFPRAIPILHSTGHP